MNPNNYTIIMLRSFSKENYIKTINLFTKKTDNNGEDIDVDDDEDGNGNGNDNDDSND
ncbi:conserved hypothetical protein [Ricinus communis]|uniref:Uncharacterized protein n=1 Tax=Ricinus communis TaxID=3988 RepID=B9SUL0_RICCO|nr:conserved hypothetical protein [Ricinus communis]